MTFCEDRFEKRSQLAVIKFMCEWSVFHDERNDADIGDSFLIDMRECVGIFCCFVISRWVK